MREVGVFLSREIIYKPHESPRKSESSMWQLPLPARDMF
jgi:hypothetical protein